MKLRWLIPVAVLIPLRLSATDAPVGARVATITINPREVTVLHLRPEFESTIRMPEEITSVILGSPGEFKAEHNEGESEYVYVKPIVKEPAQSNLLIATKSGQHVTLELISDGAPNPTQPVDFLIEYRTARSFLISADSESLARRSSPTKEPERGVSSGNASLRSAPLSSLDEAFKLQQSMNAPRWTKWEDKQIETSIGDMRQLSNQTMISYSILNSSNEPIEIVPPQIQITGRKAPTTISLDCVGEDQKMSQAFWFCSPVPFSPSRCTLLFHASISATNSVLKSSCTSPSCFSVEACSSHNWLVGDERERRTGHTPPS